MRDQLHEAFDTAKERERCIGRDDGGNFRQLTTYKCLVEHDDKRGVELAWVVRSSDIYMYVLYMCMRVCEKVNFYS